MRSGIAGTTVVWASAYASAEMLRISSVHVGLRRAACERVMAPPACCRRRSGERSAAPSGESLAQPVELVPQRLRQVVTEPLVVRGDAFRLVAPGVVVDRKQ